MNVRTGALAVVGRPNVGKSTLTNRLVGAKVSITSKKAQTTRHRVHGILTTEIGDDDCQFVFVDTPGFQTRHKNALNRLMSRSVTQALAAVDVVLFLIEAGRWSGGDRDIVRLLPQGLPVLLVINKVDRLADKTALLPFIEKVATEYEFAEIVPLSAEKGQGLDELLKATAHYLPEAPHIFEADDITDRPERFLAAELLREKLFRNLGEELPYGIAVEIEKFEQEGELRRIHAAVIVDRAAHKDMEALFGGKVWLETWVKVKSGWADDERALKTLGYE